MQASLTPLAADCEARSICGMGERAPIAAAIVDLAKLRDYCLNEIHPRGRHKAKVFRSRLGATALDAPQLQQVLQTAAINRLEDLVPTKSDAFGDRFLLDVEVELNGRTATVRCAWIVRPGEEVVRLVTCYVL